MVVISKALKCGIILHIWSLTWW